MYRRKFLPVDNVGAAATILVVPVVAQDVGGWKLVFGWLVQ